MLCLTLRPKEKTVIYIPGGDEVTILGPDNARAKIKINAPQHIQIKRLPRSEEAHDLTN